MGSGLYSSSKYLMSSSLSFTYSASIRSASFSTLVVPTMGAVTPGFERIQAREICAMLTPLRFESSSTLLSDVCQMRGLQDRKSEHAPVPDSRGDVVPVA